MKKSTTELTSSQNHSLSLAAINCQKRGWKKKGGGGRTFRMTRELCCDTITPPEQHIALFSKRRCLFLFADILYRTTESFTRLAELCKWLVGISCLPVYLFIHSQCRGFAFTPPECCSGMTANIIATVFDLKACCTVTGLRWYSCKLPYCFLQTGCEFLLFQILRLFMVHAWRTTYSQAKVQEEEDVEGHIDL